MNTNISAAAASAPVSAPPSQTPNPGNSSSEAPLVVATTAASLFVATVIVAIRLWVSLLILHWPLRWDDGLIIACWLVFIVYSALSLANLRNGLFVDIWDVRPERLVEYKKLLYAIKPVYGVLFFALKLCILALYKRLFVPSRGGNKQTWIYYTVIMVAIFNGIIYLTFILLALFDCHPIDKFWLEHLSGTCANLYISTFLSAGLNIVSDILITLIPVAVIRKLQIEARRKVEVYFIFGFSTICLAGSICRLVYSAVGMYSVDQTVAYAKAGLWTFVEIMSCFLASCVPMVPLLIRHIQGKRIRTFKGRTTSETPIRRSRPDSEMIDATWFSNDSSFAPGGHEPNPETGTETEIETGEDPYLMCEASKDEKCDDEKNSDEGQSQRISGNEIWVSRTVEISSVPKTTESAIRQPW